MMSKTLGIVFSNMHDSMMGKITEHRTMASVPFGGRYRLVDFVLSNMINSGVKDVGIITKSNFQSLMDHVGTGKEWDLSRKKGGLTILPPYGRQESVYYRGRLEALGTSPPGSNPYACNISGALPHCFSNVPNGSPSAESFMYATLVRRNFGACAP